MAASCWLGCSLGRLVLSWLHASFGSVFLMDAAGSWEQCLLSYTPLLAGCGARVGKEGGAATEWIAR